VQVLHDNGGGITQESTKHFARAIQGVKPIQVTIHNAGEFTFELYGTKGFDAIVVLESGFNSGYGGEGPHGSFEALKLLGVPKIVAEEVFHHQSLIIDFRSGTPTFRKA